MLKFVLMAILYMPLAQAADFGQFSAEKEFPNYYRGQNLEPAMTSLLSRIQLTVDSGGGKLESIAYFPYIQKRAQEICPGVRVYASGGVVRSLVGYLYEQVFNAVKAGQSPERWLKSFAAGTKPIPAVEVRGVGSDLDILVDGECADVARVLQVIQDITNSAEKAVSPARGHSQTKSFFTFADAKNYTEQIERSTAQGGSEVDFLAFDTERGRFVEPPGHSGIVHRLTEGVYRYLAPASKNVIEDPDKQTVRGLRPLLELPFLKLEDDRQFRSELTTLAKKMKSGQRLSFKAYEQFHKMVRNSRRSGANNRFYRASRGSIDEIVASMIGYLNDDKSRPLLPEFADRFDLGRATDKTLPTRFFLPMQTFTAKYTAGGVLYHGTANPENGFAILRQGLLISDRKQGYAVYGRGVYTSKDEAVAREYAGREGLLFSLRVQQDPKLKVLDWPAVENSSEIARIRKEAEQLGRDLFELLARDYGVDIIVNEHVLIQNLNAVELPKPRLGEIAKTWYYRARDLNASAIDRYAGGEEYRRLKALAVISGETDLPSLNHEELLREAREQMLHDLRVTGDLRVDPANLTVAFQIAAHPSVRAQITRFVPRSAVGGNFAWELLRQPDVLANTPVAELSAAMGHALTALPEDDQRSAVYRLADSGLESVRKNWLKYPGLADFILKTGMAQALNFLDNSYTPEYAAFIKKLAVRMETADFDPRTEMEVWKILSFAFLHNPGLREDADHLARHLRLQFTKGRTDTLYDLIKVGIKEPGILRHPAFRSGIENLLTSERWLGLSMNETRNYFRDLFVKAEAAGITEARYWAEAAHSRNKRASFKRRVLITTAPGRAFVDCKHLLSFKKSQ